MKRKVLGVVLVVIVVLGLCACGDEASAKSDEKNVSEIIENTTDPFGIIASYTYYRVSEDESTYVDGWVIAVEYYDSGAISFYLPHHGVYAYASYESESELGTETWVGGNGQGQFKVTINLEGDYLYITEPSETMKYKRVYQE